MLLNSYNNFRTKKWMKKYLLSLNALILDVSLYLKALTPKRVINLIKNVLSMMISYRIRRPIVWGYPLALNVEPTNICNLKCPLCHTGNGRMIRARGRMKLDHFRQLIDEIGDYLWVIMFWNQGEPFINKHLTEMIRMAKAKSVPAVVSTNGHFFKSKPIRIG